MRVGNDWGSGVFGCCLASCGFVSVMAFCFLVSVFAKSAFSRDKKNLSVRRRDWKRREGSAGLTGRFSKYFVWVRASFSNLRFLCFCVLIRRV